MESRSSGRDRDTAEFDRTKAQKSRSRAQETTVDRPDRPRHDVSPRRSTGPSGTDNRNRRDGGTSSGYNSARISRSPASYGDADRRASPDYGRYRSGESRGSRPSSPPRRSYDNRGHRSPRRDHARNTRDRSPPRGHGRARYPPSPRPNIGRYGRAPSPANRPSRSPVGSRFARRLSDSPPPYRAPRPQNQGYTGTPGQTGSEQRSENNQATQSEKNKRPMTIRDFVSANNTSRPDGPGDLDYGDGRGRRYNEPQGSGKRRRSIERDGNIDGTGKRARISDRDLVSQGQVSSSGITGLGDSQNAQTISRPTDSQGTVNAFAGSDNPTALNDAKVDDVAEPKKKVDADEEIARRRNRRLQMRLRMITESSANGTASTPTSLRASVVSSAAASPSLPPELPLHATSVADRTNSIPPAANIAALPIGSSELSSPPVIPDVEARGVNDSATGSVSEVQEQPNGRLSTTDQKGIINAEGSSSGIDNGIANLQPNTVGTSQQIVPSVEPSDHHDDIPSAQKYGDVADEDDLFGDNFVARPAADVPFIQQKVDSLDNEHEYYKTTINELIEGRYVIKEVLGHGSYAEVVRAYDKVTNTKVALKLFRNNPFIYRKGLDERNRLNRVADADIDGTQSHIIRLEHNFIYKQHLCFVMENMDMNLDKYVKSQGIKATSISGKAIRVISLPTIRKIAFTIFNCLKFLRDNRFVHGDIKPENILINLGTREVKIGDLGTLHDVRDSHMEEYRLDQPGTPIFMAPEIHLMVTHDFAIDTWAVGCTLYELFMGTHLFHGDSTHGLLAQIQAQRGPIGRVLLNGALPAAVAAFFTDDRPHRFRDPASGAPLVFSSNAQYAVRNAMRNHFHALAAADGYPPTNVKDVDVFIELVERCLQLDPAKRIKPDEALQHEFFKGA